MKIEFIEFGDKHLKLTSNWLNDSEINRLTLAGKITDENQKIWFDSLPMRNDYFIKIVECNDIPIGVVGLKHIDRNNCTGEYFGYIGEKAFWGMHIGSYMMEYIISVAKSTMLKEVYLYVSLSNNRAINLYKKYGFQDQSCNEALLRMSLLI